MNELEMHFGLMAVPNLWLKTPDLENDNLYPLSFWEYEDIVHQYCQKYIDKYLNTGEGDNNAKTIHTQG